MSAPRERPLHEVRVQDAHDEAARELDRRRAAADRRPDDLRAQLALAQAHAAYEAARADVVSAAVADLTRRNTELTACNGDLSRRNEILRRNLALASAELARRCAQVEAFGRLSSTIKCRRGQPAAGAARRARSGGDLFAADEGRA
jgi:cell division protein FtsB